MKKIIINLDTITDLYSKALTYLLHFIDGGMVPNKDLIKSFINKRIINGAELLQNIENDTNNLKNAIFYSESNLDMASENNDGNSLVQSILTEEQIEEHSNKLLSIHTLLCSIDDLLTNTPSAKRDLEFWNSILSAFTLANLTISEIIINNVLFVGNNISLTENYIPNMEAQNQFNNIRHEYTLYETLNDVHSVYKKELQKSILQLEIFDSQYATAGLDFLKLQTILLTFITSPFYSESTKSIANSLLSFFKDFFVDSRILKIIMEPNTESEKEEGFKTTTKLEIFFSLKNQDVYCLRIDFPHDGASFIHYNLHEPKHVTGVPIKLVQKEEIISICNSEQIFHELFFESGKRFWFRYNFEEKLLQQFDIRTNQYHMLHTLFHTQCHMHITDTNVSNTDMQIFLTDFNNALLHMEMLNCIYEKTKKVDINKELFSIKSKDILHEYTLTYNKYIEMAIIHEFDITEEISMLKKELLTIFFEATNLSLCGFSKDDLLEFDFIDIVSFIEDYLKIDS